jgi:hypothetical protein
LGAKFASEYSNARVKVDQAPHPGMLTLQ